jgi:hypothetical protein
VPEIVIVTLLIVPGRKPQYVQPGSSLGVLLLVNVLNVRLVVVLGIVLNVRLLFSLLLLLLEQTTPAGQVPLLEPLLEVLLVVVVCSCSVCSVVRWISDFACP